MNDLLFSPPFYYPLAILIIGLGAIFQGNRLQKSSILRAGIAGILLAVAWYGIAKFVETDIETVTRKTHELGAAAENRDWRTFESLLDPQIQFAFYKDREMFVKGGSETIERQNVKGITFKSLETQSNPGEIIVTFTCFATIDLMAGRPFRTNWQFYFRKNPDWQIYRIEPLNSPDVQIESIMQRLIRSVK